MRRKSKTASRRSGDGQRAANLHVVAVQDFAEKTREIAIGKNPRTGLIGFDCHTRRMDMMLLSRLKSRARRLTRSEADAEDLCHDVCLAYLERTCAGAQIDRPLPYMMTALRHAAKALRGARAKLEPLEEADTPHTDDASLACYCAEVLAHLEQLPNVDRALLKRVVFDGARPSELAAELGIPVGTVMSRLARARARLRARLDQSTG